MNIGDIVIVEGISQKGKNRVRELGNEWKVIKVSQNVLFSQEKCDWVLVAPSFDSPKFRWVKKFGDDDFRILALKKSA